MLTQCAKTQACGLPKIWTHILTAEYEVGSMTASLSGDSTSARQPNEFCAHSRKGDSDPVKLFLPSLHGVEMHTFADALGLRIFPKDPSMPATAKVRFQYFGMEGRRRGRIANSGLRPL